MDRCAKSSHLRRRLFQDEEASETAASPAEPKRTDDEIVAELGKASDEARIKWNFDFVNEVPLDGDWEWVKVEDPSRGPSDKAEELKRRKDKESNCEGRRL